MQWVNQLLLLQKHQETTCCRLENIPTPNPHKLKFDACITPTQTHPTITPMYFTSLVYTVQTSFSFFMHHSLLFTFRHILQLHPLYFTPFVYKQNKVTKECENWNIAYFRQLNGLKFSVGLLYCICCRAVQFEFRDFKLFFSIKSAAQKLLHQGNHSKNQSTSKTP